MQAVVLRQGKIVSEDVDVPKPGAGQVLVKSLCCGICGSDLHFYAHGESLLTPVDGILPDVYLGHEYVAEIIAFGPNCEQKLGLGTRVCSVPFVEVEGQRVPIGTGAGVYGAYSQYFLMSESLLLEVPDSLPSQAVALAEPLAVAIHGVARSGITASDTAVVCGAGPIGLATIAALKRIGVTEILVSEPTEHRRKLAQSLAAAQVIDPTVNSLADEFSRQGSDGLQPFIFECVGNSVLIAELIQLAPKRSTIVYAGVHTDETRFNPMLAMVKELDLKFTFYYEDAEYAEALDYLASGQLNWQPLVTGTVGYDRVQQAFEALTKPNKHVKIMVEPQRQGDLLVSP